MVNDSDICLIILEIDESIVYLCLLDNRKDLFSDVINLESQPIIGSLGINIEDSYHSAKTFSNSSLPGYGPILLLCGLQFFKNKKTECLLSDHRQTESAANLWYYMSRFRSIEKCESYGIRLLENYSKYQIYLSNGISYIYDYRSNNFNFKNIVRNIFVYSRAYFIHRYDEIDYISAYEKSLNFYIDTNKTSILWI